MLKQISWDRLSQRSYKQIFQTKNYISSFFPVASLCHGSSRTLESVRSKRQKYGNVHHIQTCLLSLKYLTCPALHAETITHADSRATLHWKGYLKIFHFDESRMFISLHVPFLCKTMFVSGRVRIFFILNEC